MRHRRLPRCSNSTASHEKTMTASYGPQQTPATVGRLVQTIDWGWPTSSIDQQLFQALLSPPYPVGATSSIMSLIARNNLVHLEEKESQHLWEKRIGRTGPLRPHQVDHHFLGIKNKGLCNFSRSYFLTNWRNILLFNPIPIQ
ncbi:hypothetical protein AMTR_s00003p00101900 [Amborella trichopoda]|uniref:Uncharacterized protein n=1 Tax=Amborella trichopoda TaxID=13333 RepID=W1P637_AMBTC|nr:hypothetical protein AMTR_s00003p00101900 [Amborella trichopoda]